MCFPAKWVKSDESFWESDTSNLRKIKQLRVKLSTDKIKLAGNDHQYLTVWVLNFLSAIAPRQSSSSRATCMIRRKSLVFVEAD